MKKLLLLLLALIGSAVLIAVIVVGRGGRHSPSLADDTVLHLRIAAPIADYLPTPQLAFWGRDRSRDRDFDRQHGSRGHLPGK